MARREGHLMYKIIPTERFNADVKYYVKKKHYVHIGEDIKKLQMNFKMVIL